MPRITIYTAIFGDIKDDLQTPLCPGQELCDWFVFTDRPGPVPAPWIKRDVNYQGLASRKLSRFLKTHPKELFPQSEIVVWHDGNIRLKDNPQTLTDIYLRGTDLAVCRHPLRQCIRQELWACRILKKDDPNTMIAQINRYFGEGFPLGFGLSETGLLLRRLTPKMHAFDQAWWNEIDKGSIRDQLSFPYVIWKTGIRPSTIEGRGVTGCPHLAFKSHW